MTRYLIAFVITFIVFVVIDLQWLGKHAKPFYHDNLGHLLAKKFDLRAAAVFYVLYILGIMVFAMKPAFETGAWQTALLYGALYGFFCYMTYELTNMAVMRDWPLKMVIVDTLWGVFLTGLASTTGFWLTLQILKKIQ